MAKKIAKRIAAKQTASLNTLNKKLDLLLKQQQQIMSSQTALAKEEKVLERDIEKEKVALEQEEKFEEQKIGEISAKEISELEDLKQLEQQIQEEVKNNPLRNITYKDFTKGMIGAFVGIVAHFSFLEGLHVAENFDMIRATMLFMTSFVIGVAFLYFSGFRSVGDKLVLKFIPLRILIIYSSALFVILLVLWMFGVISLQSHFEDVYKTVSAISILAILGACTADLIGKEH